MHTSGNTLRLTNIFIGLYFGQKLQNTTYNVTPTCLRKQASKHASGQASGQANKQVSKQASKHVIK